LKYDDSFVSVHIGVIVSFITQRMCKSYSTYVTVMCTDTVDW